AEALAVRAGAEGIIEGEEAGLGGFEAAAAVLALEALVEAEGWTGGRTGELEDRFAGLAVGDLDAVHQAGAELRGIGLEFQAIDEDKDGLVEVEVEQRLGGGELDQLAGLPEAVEAAGAEFGQARLDAGLAAAQVGGEQQQAALAGGLGEERGDSGIHVVALDLEVAVGAEDAAGAGGKGLDVAALAFGVDGVEGEAAFARAADAGDDGEGVEGDVHAQVLEVVEAGAVDAEDFAGGPGFCVHCVRPCTRRTSSSTYSTGVSGRMPWPRLKMKPRWRLRSRDRAWARSGSPPVTKRAGSRLPWSAGTGRPASGDQAWRRGQAASSAMRQSRLSASAPVSAVASR